MRTEQQLTAALEHVAERTPASEDALQRIVARTSPTTVRRRRAVLILATAFVVILAIVVPTVLVDRTVVPADTRPPKDWNSSYRIELEPGWKVLSREVTAESETATVLVPMSKNDYPGGCTIQVDTPGQREPDIVAERHIAVEVNGRPGFQTPSGKHDEAPVSLAWRYRENAWAQVDCQLTTHAQSLEIARRMVFEPTPVRVPYRLKSLPDGYAVRATADGVYEGTDLPGSGVSFDNLDPALPPMNIDVYPRAIPESKAETPGNWGGSVSGLPAVYDNEGTNLSVSYQGYQILVEMTDGWPVDVPRSLWPQKYRELAIDVVSRLELVPDMSSPDSWPDANQALNP